MRAALRLSHTWRLGFPRIDSITSASVPDDPSLKVRRCTTEKPGIAAHLMVMIKTHLHIGHFFWVETPCKSYRQINCSAYALDIMTQYIPNH